MRIIIIATTLLINMEIIIMPTDYQPRIADRNLRIRKAINNVRKKTRLDKSLIVERMLIYSIEKVTDIFPELEK